VVLVTQAYPTPNIHVTSRHKRRCIIASHSQSDFLFHCYSRQCTANEPLMATLATIRQPAIAVAMRTPKLTDALPDTSRVLYFILIYREYECMSA
jgi:hypothetical protein